MMKRLTLIMIFAASLLTVGCVDQDLGRCDASLTVKFEYSYNELDKDLVISDVTRMDLYAFDMNGILADYWRSEGADFEDRMQVDLKPGKYSLVAWGGEQNCTSYNVSAFSKGVTTFEQMRTILKRNNGILDTKPNDQYYGSLGFLEVKQGANTANVSLIKNTNNIKVTVKGLNTILAVQPAPGDNTALDHFQVRISGDNSKYRFDNTFDISNPANASVLYIPFDRTATHEQIECDFRVMRLARQAAHARAAANNIINLQIYDSQSNQVIKNFDLIDEIITQHPLVNPNPVAVLDKYSDYNIEIVYSISGWSVYLEIMDWKVRVVNVDMD